MNLIKSLRNAFKSRDEKLAEQLEEFLDEYQKKHPIWRTEHSMDVHALRSALRIVKRRIGKS